MLMLFICASFSFMALFSMVLKEEKFHTKRNSTNLDVNSNKPRKAIISQSFVGHRGAGNGISGLLTALIIGKYTNRCNFGILSLNK